MILNDKKIIVIGSEGLIAKKIVDEILHEGGQPICLDLNIVTDKNENRYNFDITNFKKAKINLEDIISSYDKIDGFVNCSYPKTSDWGTQIESVSNKSFIKNLDIQLVSFFNALKIVTKHMKKFNEGSILSFSSIYGLLANDFNLYRGTEINPPVAYSAIKGGLISLNRYLASFYGKYNIRFNCISPGGVYDKQDQKFVERYEEKVPLGRMARPEDISSLAIFLLSDGSSYLTGQNLIVDGGYSVK